jgi:MYXO-CTERM domain-containing protein
MRKAWKTASVTSIVAMLTISPAYATDYSAPGPLTVTTGNLGSTEGGSTGGYVVVPEGAGPFPLIIASHGWSAAADQQVGWGKQFASYGFVVVAPSFPNTLSPNDATDATIIETLVTLYSDPAHASPAQGKVDPTRVGLEGHSAGGLATTLASAAIHPTATALFDPVDSNGDGQKALPSICNPLLGIFADPSSCNDQEAWFPFANTTAGPEVLFHVVGSTHCDGENASRALCGSVCGGAASPTRQAEYARYATAFFLAELAGDTTAAATLTAGSVSADTGIAGVTVKPGAPCSAGAPDAGEPGAVDGGGSSSGGGSKDAGGHAPGSDASAADAQSGAGAGGVDEAGAGGSSGASTGNAAGSTGESAPPTQSSGCSCHATESAPGGWMGIVLAAGLVVIRRVRRAAVTRQGAGRASRRF